MPQNNTGKTVIDSRKKELDSHIKKIRTRINSEYRRSMSEFVRYYTQAKGGKDYVSGLEEISRRYAANVREALAEADAAYRQARINTVSTVGALLPSGGGDALKDLSRFSVRQPLSGGKETAIESARRAFVEEARLMTGMLDSSPDAFFGGKMTPQQYSYLMRMKNDPFEAAKAGVNLPEWKKKVYGFDTYENSSALLGNVLSRYEVAEDYALENALTADIPEVIGYRIEVAKTNKYGRARHRDICDELAGDYPKDFVFKGWHYNCRCVVHPIIDKNLLTPALAARGFVGADKNTRITVPASARKLITENYPAYSDAFPALVNSNYVNYRGQMRFLQDMGVDEKLNYYLDGILREADGFFAGASAVQVNVSASADKDVMMDTRKEGNRYRINMSDAPASDGHNPARHTLEAFQKAGTGVPLTREQMSATSDLVHEMVHTMSEDYTMSEAMDKYPQYRDDFIDFSLVPDSPQRQALEMITEWYSREIYPQVAAKQGWTLPDDYARHIGTGYRDMVANFEGFISTLENPERFRASVAEILRGRDKAMAYRKLAELIKKSGALKKGYRAQTLLDNMIYESPESFAGRLEKSVTAAHGAVAASAKVLPPAQLAARMEQAAGAIDAVPTFGQMGLDGGKTAKMLAEGLDVNKNGYNIFGLRYNRFLRGAAALGAITSGAVISSAVEDVERSESGAQEAAGQHDGGDKRYIPRNWYEGSWIMTATQAGVIDSAIDMGMVTGEMVWNVGKVLTLGVASDLSKLKIWGPSAQAYLDSKAGKYGQVRDTLEDYSEETWEFIKNYVGNPAFKAAFDNEMSAMLTDYGKSLWGLDKEAGYQRGRLIGDLLLFFFSAGKVGKLLGNWKRLRRFNIKELLPGVGKTLPKTPAPKALPDVRKTLPASKAPNLSQYVDRRALDAALGDESGKLASNMSDDELREYLEKKKEQQKETKTTGYINRIKTLWTQVKNNVNEKIAHAKTILKELHDYMEFVKTNPNLTEEEKQEIFKTSEIKTITILMDEFLRGEGAEKRVFTESDKITQGLKNSNMTKVALRKFYDEYMRYKREDRKDMPKKYQIDLEPFTYKGYNTSVLNELQKDKGYSTSQFVGSATYYYDFDPDTEILTVKVEDYKTAKSFLYHIGGNKMEYDRDKFKIMGKTEQNYIFSISLQEIKKILNENAN